MTLNDITVLSLHYISPNSVAIGAHYVKVVKDTPMLSAAEM